MRRIILGTFVLFAACAAGAQVATQKQQTGDDAAKLRILLPTRQGHLTARALPLLPDQDSKLHIEIHDLVPEVAMQGFCYTMREYLFSQPKDGSMPRPKGYTNCVSANEFHLQEAEPELNVVPKK